MRRRRILSILSCSALGLAVGASTASAAATISDDTTNKVITITGDASSYQLKLDYNNKAVITSYKVGTHETLGTATGGGIYSALTTDDSTWVTSLSGVTGLTRSISGNVVTVSFSTSLASETWTLTANGNDVVFKLSRTYSGSASIKQQGTPSINLAQHTADVVRWPGDGSSWPVEPASISSGGFGDYWIGSTSPHRTSMRVSKEQQSFSVLNESGAYALKVTGTSSAGATARGATTVAQRLPDSGTGGMLRMNLYTANAGQSYALTPTMPDGSAPADPPNYDTSASTPAPTGYWSHTSTRGEDLYAPVSVTSGTTVWTQLTLAPASYSSYYDLGTLTGLGSVANLSKSINDLGRFTITDKAQLGYYEGPNWRSELVPSEEHWIAQLVDGFQQDKAGAIGAMEGGLKDQRDSLQDSSGHLYTGVTTVNQATSWGRNLPDSQTGYALAVLGTYYMNGSTSWLGGFRTSVEKALDYEQSAYASSSTNLIPVSYAAHNPGLHSNEYWEAAWWTGEIGTGVIGQPNAYTSAMYYDALRRWATVEGTVFSDTTKAAYYNGLANTLKTNYNLDAGSGGTWSGAANAPRFSAQPGQPAYLPVIGAALKSDLLSAQRRRDMAAAYIQSLRSTGTDFLVNNVFDLDGSGAFSDYTHLGTDGGMYGQGVGDGYAAFPAADDRANAKYFTEKWLGKAMSNWYGSSNFSRSAAQLGADTDFPSIGNMGAGLYHDIFGFQPGDQKLVIAPFIWSDLVGSTVNYTWRGQAVTVAYNGLDKFTVTIPSMPSGASVDVRFLNQTPSRGGYVVKTGSSAATVSADADGTVHKAITSAGTTTVELANPDPDPVISSADDNGGAITYNPAWSYSTTVSAYRNGNAHYTNSTGAYAQYAFTGTGVRVIGGKGLDHGRMSVSIDGTTVASGIETYANVALAQQELFRRSGLTPGSHTIRITVDGTKSASSSNTYVDLDAIDVDTGWTTTNDMASGITYTSGWQTTTTPTDYVNGDAHYSNVAGDYAQWTFTGTAVRVLGGLSPDHGKADVSIDGGTPVTVDAYAASVQPRQELFKRTGLSPGSHTIRVTIDHTKNASASDYYVDLDAFETAG
ncbi:MAG TPA: hypothetical protein VFG42_14410 [Baekduia sp.]|uniref:hypothetical protein n=1 Tax=Baekduia sp. TaxID=2600305 RepID=UPI002D7A0A14|nr:hypothetical protein [Baekduia sp.]HET6507980.1 hypothetical protein [Baekduia sp.]